jgi:DNA polymerase-3 subunit chi
MTAVAFHFNVPQRLDYTCRLLRKATRAGARVVVTGDDHDLATLDRQLWVFDPLEFVAHWRGPSVNGLPKRLRHTPVLLLELPSAVQGHAVLMNLGPAAVQALEGFDRLIEVVGLDEAGRSEARLRWKHYSALGLTIERHDVKVAR